MEDKSRKRLSSIDEIMNVVSKMAKARHASTAMVILSICVAGFLFMGSPLVNAQSEEFSSLDEKLAYIEGTLEQMNERLKEINHLSERIDEIGGTLSVRIDKLHNTILVGVIGIIAAILVQPFASAYANKKFKT